MEWIEYKGLYGNAATVINGMALQGALEDKGMLRLQTALKIEAIAEPYIKEEQYILKRQNRNFGAGTETLFHNRYSSRFAWCEIHADVILKGTK
jgi:uridylate kinase